MLRPYAQLLQRRLIPQSIAYKAFPRTPTQLRHFNYTHNYRSKMAELRPIHTKDACPPAGPYSQALLTPHAIYVSGQIPATPTGELPSGTIAYKTSLCIANLKAILAAGGSDISKVVKTTVFLTDMKNFAEVNEEYVKHFGVNGAPKPARSCVAVHQLPKGVEVEIECVALPGGAAKQQHMDAEEAELRAQGD